MGSLIPGVFYGVAGLAGSAGSLAPWCCIRPHKTSGVLGAGFMGEPDPGGVDDASPTERPRLLLPKGFPPAFLLSGCGFLGLQGPGSQALPAGFAFWVVPCYFFFCGCFSTVLLATIGRFCRVCVAPVR